MCVLPFLFFLSQRTGNKNNNFFFFFATKTKPRTVRHTAKRSQNPQVLQWPALCKCSAHSDSRNPRNSFVATQLTLERECVCVNNLQVHEITDMYLWPVLSFQWPHL